MPDNDQAASNAPLHEAESCTSEPSPGSNNISGAGGAEGPLVVTTTYPNEIYRHNISDEELDMFSSWRTDHLTELWYVAIGGLVGSFVPAVNNLYIGFFSANASGLGFVNFMEITAFVVALTAFLVCYIIRNKRGDNLENKIREIRDRAKRETLTSLSVENTTIGSN